MDCRLQRNFFAGDEGAKPRGVGPSAPRQSPLKVAAPRERDGFCVAHEQEAKHGVTIAGPGPVCTFRLVASSLPAIQKGEPLEQMHILLVLEQRAVQRRNQFFWIALAKRLWRHILVEQ
jgi:hypothetical protein